MVRDVVRLRVRRYHFIALFERRTHNQRLPIFFQPRNQLAANFERRRPIGGALLHAVERKRHLANVLESHHRMNPINLSSLSNFQFAAGTCTAGSAGASSTSTRIPPSRLDVTLYSAAIIAAPTAPKIA